MIRLTSGRFHSALFAGALAVLVGCQLSTNLGDGPAEAQCADMVSRANWCPGGTIHLKVSGEHPVLEFWLLGTGPDEGSAETDLIPHDITDVPSGTYRAIVPWVKCTGTCGGEPVRPFRCEGVVEVPAYGDERSVEVSFDAAHICTITTPAS